MGKKRPPLVETLAVWISTRQRAGVCLSRKQRSRRRCQSGVVVRTPQKRGHFVRVCSEGPASLAASDLIGQVYNQRKKPNGGDRKSDYQNDNLIESTCDAVAVGKKLIMRFLMATPLKPLPSNLAWAGPPPRRLLLCRCRRLSVEAGRPTRPRDRRGDRPGYDRAGVV